MGGRAFSPDGKVLATATGTGIYLREMHAHVGTAFAQVGSTKNLILFCPSSASMSILVVLVEARIRKTKPVPHCSS
jgi:hypothetical protein